MIFSMSSGVPRQGVWHCSLHSEHLHWHGFRPVLRMMRCKTVSLITKFMDVYDIY